MPSWAGGAVYDDEDEDAATSLVTSVEVVTENDSAKEKGPAVKKSLSGDSKESLASLKAQLEILETRKEGICDEEEKALKILQREAASLQRLLEQSVNGQISLLQAALTELRSYSASGSSQNLLEIASVSATGSQSGSQVVKPSAYSGRDAALALAWFETHKTQLTDSQTGSGLQTTLSGHIRSVKNELAFLRQMGLAAKVVANVTSSMHKKLLNLSHAWLSTFLPHCLAKVNRVSFGLLSVEDCKAAIEENPYVPRSRLKLAVPFVGNTVLTQY